MLVLDVSQIVSAVDVVPHPVVGELNMFKSSLDNTSDGLGRLSSAWLVVGFASVGNSKEESNSKSDFSHDKYYYKLRVDPVL